MVNKILVISLATTMVKKLKLYKYSFQKWVHFDETECMYFVIKEEVFDKYKEIWEKVNKIIKGIISELIYSKKYLIPKKTFNTKESFQFFL